MSTTALKTISAALKLVDTKKENLKKAFEDLQAHSSLLSSFPLNWSDLDSHFSSVHNSLTHRFHRLESLEAEQSRPATANDPFSSTSSQPPASQDRIYLVSDTGPVSSEFKNAQACHNDPSSSNTPGQAAARPQLKAFCEKMDGKGLRRYIGELSGERVLIKHELPDAIRRAPDPGALVMDAVDGFYAPSKGDWDSDLGAKRRICELLLETLMGLNHSCSGEVRERAKKLAFEWKSKVNTNEDNMSLSMGFLLLVGAYRLVSEFNKDELVDYLLLISARHRQTTELIRVIGLQDKVPDLIRKVISKGKQLLGVKFVFEFNLTDQFPPVPLLKTYVKESKKLAQKVRTEGNNSLKSLNEATAKEVSAMRSVIKVIEEHNLESEYPKVNLEKHIDQLEKEKANRKRPATAAPTAKPQQQNGSKRPRSTVAVDPAAVPMSVAGASSTISSFQQSHLPQAGLLLDRSAPYMVSAAGPYGLVGSTPAAAPYVGSSSAGLYGVAGGPIGFPGNPSPAGSQLYTSDPHLISSYSDRPTSYVGYSMPPQYHSAYYP